MLVNIDTRREMRSVPYKETYDLTERMSADDFDAICAKLNSMIDRDLEKGRDIQTAGWMPGKDWTGTPFQPIYEKSARRNQGLAARIFGLIVWKVFMDREETWLTGRFEKDGKPIRSRTYFQPGT